MVVYNEETGAKSFQGASRKLFKVEGDILPDEFYELKVKANRPLDDAELKQLFDLVDYSWVTTVKAPALEYLGRTGKKSFGAETDLSRSFSHDPKGRAKEFIDGLNAFVASGSPQRKTKNNTRLVEGLPDVKVSVWVSNVYKDVK
jgi:hypothetical protein